MDIIPISALFCFHCSSNLNIDFKYRCCYYGFMSVLDVKNLNKTFPATGWSASGGKDFKAVNNISFSLKEGEILGLLGPNGAGKTTTIQMLLAVMKLLVASFEVSCCHSERKRRIQEFFGSGCFGFAQA